MEIKYEASRALTYKVAQMIDDGIIDSDLSSCAKAFASEACFGVANEALQIHGGYGYSKEYPIEIILRNCKIGSIFEGTNEVQRMVITKGLVKASGLM